MSTFKRALAKVSRRAIVVSITTLMACGSAYGAIIDSLNVEQIALPAVAGFNTLQSDTTFRVFEENTVTQATVDVQTFTVGDQRRPTSAHTEGTITATFTSYTVLFDPVSASATDLDGWLEFDRKILGIIWHPNDLEASDALLNPFTLFTTDLRGLESFSDQVTFTSTRRVDLSLSAGNSLDTLRILVAAPAPSLWMLLMLGFAGVGAMRRVVSTSAGSTGWVGQVNRNR